MKFGLIWFFLIFLAYFNPSSGGEYEPVVTFDNDPQRYRLKPFHCDYDPEDVETENINGHEVPKTCIEQMREASKEDNDRGIWTAFAVGDSGNLFRVFKVLTGGLPSCEQTVNSPLAPRKDRKKELKSRASPKRNWKSYPVGPWMG